MTAVNLAIDPAKTPIRSEPPDLLAPPARPRLRHLRRTIPVLFTLSAIVVAGLFARAMWRAYMETPWTRDATVRAYVVTMAPEVAGRIVQLPVIDNQYVHKGDLLMVIDPTDFEIAVRLADAAVDRAKVEAKNAKAQAERRLKLTTKVVSQEEQETFSSSSVSADATYQQALARRDQARVDLERTRIVSPVNGYVTNLQAQIGDFAAVGEARLSLVNADSFWVDAYFEETNLQGIREGEAAAIKLMGQTEIIHGHVDSIARGINVANAQPDSSGLASVNPLFTWVRLAQRVPVRIHLDKVPEDTKLAAGMTATVQIDQGSPERPAGGASSLWGIADDVLSAVDLL